MSSKRKHDWNNFREKISKKRTGSGKANKQSSPTTLTIQRLSPHVEGKCQKYSRIGPLALVSIENEPTLANIKAACQTHFGTNSECDVLAGERGPSYTDESQIQNWKVLHIRFIEKSSEVLHFSTFSHHSEPTKESILPEEDVSTTTFPKSAHCSVAASVSLSHMLKMGKLIQPGKQIVNLHLQEFSVAEMRWLDPFNATFLLQPTYFAKGGFREAYIAKAIGGIDKGDYVLKRYIKEKVPEIEALFGTIEAHTRKAVQMNALARNFAHTLQLERPFTEYGETFVYTKVYYSSFNGDFVTLEKFLEGEFTKYINNTGELCSESVCEISLKAQAFVHFTYERSDHKLMVTDIQGVGYSLCDPEIASADLCDEDESILFCSGNLSMTAISNFLVAHVCNKFCKLLKLKN